MLILEDDVHVGKVVKMIAQGIGFEARLETSAEAFFLAVDEWQPTYIAVDLVMPDMDGVQVLAELAKRACSAKIIITSGMSLRVLEAAERAGTAHGLNIVGALPKPFSAARLRALLTQESAHTQASEPTLGSEQHASAQDGFHPSEADLRRALAQREFSLVYQPKIDCKTSTVAGFEALARWNHPDVGLVMPDQFIPALNDVGLIDALTDILLDEALPWFSSFTAQFTLSVNFSARTFRSAAFLDRIVSRCVKYEVAPERMIFELTETDSMEDPLVALDLTTRLRMKGFQLSIDDFGMGYSSLLQLTQLPFSELKVDKSFVLPLKSSADARTVVKSIVDLARGLGLKSVAEGVEDLATFEYLKSIDCDLAQGFAIARPLNGDAIGRWLVGRREHGLIDG